MGMVPQDRDMGGRLGHRVLGIELREMYERRSVETDFMDEPCLLVSHHDGRLAEF